jgi:PKD repeat protein
MKKMRLIAGIISLIGLTAVIFTACKEEESKPLPDASFSFVASGDGRTIQFTNESTDATTYLWAFGDGTATSAEESPMHTYPDYGTFDVTLTATGDGGEDVFTYPLVVTKASPVKLDDNSFDDWANVALAFQSVDNSGGLIEKIKIDYDGEFIYFWMEVKDNLTDSLPTGIHFDLDNDTLTGFRPWTNTGIGTEFYTEASVTTGVEYSPGAFMFDKDAAAQTDWSWIEKTITDYILFGYHVQVGDKVQTEWAIRKSKLDAITTNGNVVLGNKVTIIINHYFEWNPAGFFPGSGEAAYVLNMI